MIRVLHVLGGLNLGGAETMVMNLYRAIDRTKIQFDFIIHLQEKQAYEDEVIALGGKIYRFPAFNGKSIIKQVRVWNEFFISHKEYQILHSHVRSYASIYLPIAKKHGVYTIIHSHSTSNGRGILSWIKTLLQYPLRFQADYFFACSFNAGKWLFGKRVVQCNNFEVFPNAIDASLFDYNPDVRIRLRRKLEIEDKFVIGHVGRMTEPKNHKFLIEIFEKVEKKSKNAVLLLVGDGELRDKIEQCIYEKKLQETIILVGNKINTQDYYQAMDVFAFPSLWEGLGIVAIEAQTSGLPCIVSDGVPREVDLNMGLVTRVYIDNSDKWADEIMRYRGCTNSRHSYSEDVKKAGYDINMNVKKMQAFYISNAERNFLDVYHEIR